MTSPRDPDAREALAPRCYFCGDEIERNSDRWGHFYFCGCGARGPYGKTPSEARERYATLRQPATPGGGIKRNLVGLLRAELPNCKDNDWEPPKAYDKKVEQLASDIHAIYTSPPPSDDRAKVVEALEFYRDEAESLARYMAEGKENKSDAILASVTVLSLDGGRRARRALSPSTPPTESELRQASPSATRVEG